MRKKYEPAIALENTKEVPLRAIMDAGFTSVMPKDERNPNFRKDVEEAKKLGFAIPYIHASSNNIDQLWAEGAAKKKYISETISTMKFCKDNDIKTMVMHPAFGDPAMKPNPPSVAGIKNFSELLKIAQDLGITIAFENVANGIEHLEFLLDNMHLSDHDISGLKFCWDTGHNRHYDKGIDFMKKYGDRLGAVHISDTNATWKPGQDHTFDFHLLPGDGDIDFEEVGTKIAKSSYTGPIMLETLKNSASDKVRKYDNMSVERYLRRAYTKAKELSDFTTRKDEEVNNVN